MVFDSLKELRRDDSRTLFRDLCCRSQAGAGGAAENRLRSVDMLCDALGGRCGRRSRRCRLTLRQWRTLWLAEPAPPAAITARPATVAQTSSSVADGAIARPSAVEPAPEAYDRNNADGPPASPVLGHRNRAVGHRRRGDCSFDAEVGQRQQRRSGHQSPPVHDGVTSRNDSEAKCSANQQAHHAGGIAKPSSSPSAGSCLGLRKPPHPLRRQHPVPAAVRIHLQTSCVDQCVNRPQRAARS